MNRCPSLSYDCDVDRLVKKPMLHHLFDLLGPPRVEQPIERLLKPPLLKSTIPHRCNSRTSSLDTNLPRNDSGDEKCSSDVRKEKPRRKSVEKKKSTGKSTSKRIQKYENSGNEYNNNNLLGEKILLNSDCIEFLSCEENHANNFENVETRTSQQLSLPNRAVFSKSDGEIDTKSKSYVSKSIVNTDPKTKIFVVSKKTTENLNCPDCFNVAPGNKFVIRRNSTGLLRYSTISSKIYTRQLGFKGGRNASQENSIARNLAQTTKYYLPEPIFNHESAVTKNVAALTNQSLLGQRVLNTKLFPSLDENTLESCMSSYLPGSIKRRKSISSFELSCFRPKTSEGKEATSQPRVAEEVAADTFVPVAFNSTFQRLRQQLLGVDLGEPSLF